MTGSRIYNLANKECCYSEIIMLIESTCIHKKATVITDTVLVSTAAWFCSVLSSHTHREWH